MPRTIATTISVVWEFTFITLHLSRGRPCRPGSMSKHRFKKGDGSAGRREQTGLGQNLGAQHVSQRLGGHEPARLDQFGNALAGEMSLGGNFGRVGIADE